MTPPKQVRMLVVRLNPQEKLVSECQLAALSLQVRCPCDVGSMQVRCRLNAPLMQGAAGLIAR